MLRMQVAFVWQWGSASDAEHIAGELMKGFLKKRPIEESLHKRLAEVRCPGEVIGSQLQQGMPAISWSRRQP